LIQENKIVGMTAWKRIGTGTEGLPLSISSKEIFKWISTINGIEVQ